METNELAKKAFDAMKELEETGFCKASVQHRNYGCNRDEKDTVSTVHLDKGRSLCILNIYTSDTWENISSVIAMAYKICDEARNLHYYHIKNPDPQEALFQMFGHYKELQRP